MIPRAILMTLICAAALAPVDAGTGRGMSATQPVVPEYARQLERAYGPPSEQGFGSAFFLAKLRTGESLADTALETYRRFED
jgi:hypothetical protein